MSYVPGTYEYQTYVTEGSRCENCGFLIENEPAERRTNFGATGHPSTVFYRHVDLDGCAEAKARRKARVDDHS